MIIKFSETSTKELELLDFEQDNIEGLGEAIDICSQTIKNGNNSQFYLYFVLTQPQFTINLEKDVRENKTYLFKRKKIIKEKNDLKNQRSELERELIYKNNDFKMDENLLTIKEKID